MSNLDKALEVYTQSLKAAIQKYPDDYVIYKDNPGKADVVAKKMIESLAKGSANIDSPAFRAAAKQLGIKNTQTAWRAYLKADAGDNKPAEGDKPAAKGDPNLEKDINTIVRALIPAPVGKSFAQVDHEPAQAHMETFERILQRKWPDFSVKMGKQMGKPGLLFNKPKTLTLKTLGGLMKSVMKGQDTAALPGWFDFLQPADKQKYIADVKAQFATVSQLDTARDKGESYFEHSGKPIRFTHWNEHNGKLQKAVTHGVLYHGTKVSNVQAHGRDHTKLTAIHNMFKEDANRHHNYIVHNSAWKQMKARLTEKHNDKAAARKYYTLAVFEGGRWSPAFGDYDRSGVKSEMDDYKDSGTYKKMHMQIVTSGATKKEIDAAIAALNEKK